MVKHDIRPERPELEDAPGLTNEIWNLAEQCWRKDAKERPDAGTICGALRRIRDSSAPTCRRSHPRDADHSAGDIPGLLRLLSLPAESSRVTTSITPPESRTPSLETRSDAYESEPSHYHLSKNEIPGFPQERRLVGGHYFHRR